MAIAVLAVATLGGLALRLKMYWMARSLWLDPAMLALNLIEKTPGQLLGPLDWNQAAPAGFLLLSKGIGALFDYSELSLTFLPFVFSCVALLGFLHLSVEALGLAWAPAAFIPFAACSTAVYYAGEFKQYGGDLAVSVVLLVFAIRIAGQPESRRWLALWTLLSVAGVWLSHIAIFVAAGTGAVLLLLAVRQRHRIQAMALSVSLVAAHFLGLYWLQIRRTASADLYGYHQEFFASLSFSRASLDWWVDLLVGYTQFPFGFEGWAFPALAMIGLGLSTWLVRGPSRVLVSMLALPLAALVLASAFGRYPMVAGNHDIHSRFLLFTLPMSTLFFGLGVRMCSRFAVGALPARRRWLASSLGLLVTLAVAHSSIWRTARWPQFLQQEMKPLVSELGSGLQPGDLIYVYNAAVPAFRFYTRDEPLPFVAGTPNREPSVDMREQLSNAALNRRVWVVISHDYSGVEVEISRLLEAHRPSITRSAFPGAVLIRADAKPDFSQSDSSKHPG